MTLTIKVYSQVSQLLEKENQESNVKLERYKNIVLADLYRFQMRAKACVIERIRTIGEKKIL